MARVYNITLEIRHEKQTFPVTIPVWVQQTDRGNYAARYRKAPPFGKGESEREAVEAFVKRGYFERWIRFESGKIAAEIFAAQKGMRFEDQQSPDAVFLTALKTFIARLNFDNHLTTSVKAIEFDPNGSYDPADEETQKA